MSLKPDKLKVLPPSLEPGPPHNGLLAALSLAWQRQDPEWTMAPEHGRGSPSTGSTAAQARGRDTTQGPGTANTVWARATEGPKASRDTDSEQSCAHLSETRGYVASLG